MTTTALPGFGNQLGRESRAWWRTRRWLVQAAIWTALTNGLLFLVLWVLPGIAEAAGEPEPSISDSATQFAGMAAALASVGAVVAAQGALLDERAAGVLEWVLSKPLTRTALLLAKFVGHGLALLVALVAVPWAGVWLQLSLADGAAWPVGRWLATVALVGLLVLFHLALLLLLSVLTWSRAAVVAVPLAGIFGSDLAVAAVPEIADWLPWTLTRLTGPVLSDGVLAGAQVPVVAVAGTALALAAAAAVFTRSEL